MAYDGVSQRAPRLVRARPAHGSDLAVKRRRDILFRTVYECVWDEANAVLDRPQPLWGTLRPPLRLAAPPCCAQLDLVLENKVPGLEHNGYYELLGGEGPNPLTNLT